MRKIERVLLFACGTLFAISSQAAAAIKTAETIEFEFPNLEGEMVSLDDEDFKGKVVLVDIWGTWCPPCRKSIPHLKELHEEFGDQGLEIVGIAFEKTKDDDKNLKTVRDFVKKEKIGYTVLYGGPTSEARKIEGIEEFTGFPSVVIIGRDGKVKKTVSGYSWFRMRDIRKTVEDLMEE